MVHCPANPNVWAQVVVKGGAMSLSIGGRSYSTRDVIRFVERRLPEFESERTISGKDAGETTIADIDDASRKCEAQYQTQKQELEAAYPGEWLAIHEGEVILHSPLEDAVHRRLWEMRRDGRLGRRVRVYIRKTNGQAMSSGPARPRTPEDFPT